MATKTKISKKVHGSKTVKTAKVKAQPAKKAVLKKKTTTKSIAPKKGVKKTVRSTTTTVAKSITKNLKKPAEKIMETIVSMKKVLTGEGWRRMMVRDHKKGHKK